MNLSQNNSLLSKIKDFEQKTNIIIPKDLQRLLQENREENSYNFTRFVDSTFESEMSLEKFFSIEEIEQIYFNLIDYSEFNQAVPQGKLIPLGESLGSPIICILSSKKADWNGKIYVWDGDFGATYQADSLADFLSQLRVYEEVLV